LQCWSLHGLSSRLHTHVYFLELLWLKAGAPEIAVNAQKNLNFVYRRRSLQSRPWSPFFLIVRCKWRSCSLSSCFPLLVEAKQVTVYQATDTEKIRLPYIPYLCVSVPSFCMCDCRCVMLCLRSKAVARWTFPLTCLLKHPVL